MSVRADNRIQVTVLSPAASATVNITHTVRSLAIVAGLGLVIAFGVPWIIDAQVSRQMTGGTGHPRGNEDTWALSGDLLPRK